MRYLFLCTFTLLLLSGCTQSFLDNYKKDLLSGSPTEEDKTPKYNLTQISTSAKKSLTTFEAVKFKSKIYYVGMTEEYGDELWSMDLDTQNRKLVKDIYPGSKGSEITAIKSFDDLMFFWANDGEHGLELWRSDGSTEGTYLLYDFYPGVRSIHSTSNLNSFEIVKLNDKYYFSAVQYSDEVTGLGMSVPTINKELWRTDGHDNTVKLENYESSSEGSSPKNLTVYNNEVYFLAQLPSYGRELFHINNSLEVPLMVTERNVGVDDSYRSSAVLKVFSDKLMINSVDVIGVATAAYNGSVFFDYSESLFRNIEYNNNLYFSADTGNGDELHLISNADTETLVEVADINLSGSSFPTYFDALSNEGIIFTYDTSGSSIDDQLALWNGSSVVDIVALEGNGYLNYDFMALKNSIVFLTGNSSGLSYIYNISGGSVISTVTLNNHFIGLVLDEIVIYQDLISEKIYKYNVTNDQVTEINGDSFPKVHNITDISPFNDGIIYQDRNDNNDFYFSKDNTRISLEPSGWNINTSGSSWATKDYVYYGVRNSSFEWQLARTDGSSVMELLLSSNASSTVGAFGSTDTKLLYFANFGSGSRIHCYDEETDVHTDLGTSLGLSYNYNVNKDHIEFDNGFLISAGTSFTDSKLYYLACDGIGSKLIKDTNPSSPYDGVSDFIKDEVTGLIYFSADDNSGDSYIYQTDGTESGTVKFDPSTNYGTFTGTDIYISSDRHLYVCAETLDKYNLDTLDKEVVVNYTDLDFITCENIIGSLNSGKIVIEASKYDKREIFIYNPLNNEHIKVTSHSDAGGYGSYYINIKNNYVYYQVNQGLFGGEVWRIYDDASLTQELVHRTYNNYYVTRRMNNDFIYISRTVRNYIEILTH